MNVPPVIPTKPAGAATAPAAGVGTGDEDFASMIPTLQDDGHPVETTDGSGPETPSNPAVATTAQLADPADHPPGNVIQSLIAESKLQSRESSPFGSELQRVGDIEAALTIPKSTEATTTPAVTTPKIGATVGSATPENPPGARSGPISLAGVLTDFTNPPQGQPTQQASVESVGASPTPGTAPDSTPDTTPGSTPGSTAGTTPGTTPGTTAIVGDSMPLNAQPGALPVPPLAQQAPVLTNTDIDAPDAKPRIARAGQAGKANPNAATGPAPNTSVVNTAAPTQSPSGLVAGITAGPEVAGSEARLDAASQAAGTPFDGAAAKALPMTSVAAAAANPAAAQSGMINDTAAAFGSGLHLGADGIRPTAAADQVFHGQPAQPASEQVAVRISRAVQQGADRITVNLKPASLGRISIDLEVGPDNRLIAVIAADRPETLDLMQRDARTLERLLNDAGLKTDSGSLSFNLRGDGGGDHADGDPGGDASDWSTYAAPGDAANATPMPVYARTLSADGGIDIRV